MTSTLLVVGWFTAFVIVLCGLLVATRNARRLSYAAPLPLRPSRRFLLQFNSDAGSYRDRTAQRPWGTGLTKSEAEDLLDWLEANGQSRKLTFDPAKGFTVQ